MKTITKILIIILFSIFYSLNSNAQVVTGMNYQAVIRNTSNALVANTVVGVKISILQGSAAGTVGFSERHTPTTNANGLATFVIGEGTAITSNFFNIDWLAGQHFIKTDTDPTGGTNYTITNTSQLNTVPYSQVAENSFYAANSGDSWKKTGNTVDLNTDFIGSTNDVDVAFKRNNAKAGKLGATNTYLGVGAGEFNTMGGNVAIGTNALNKGGGGGSVGNLNTAVGYDAYPNNIDGYGNSAFGHASLLNNTNGIYNTAIGNGALSTLTTGNRNIGLGQNTSVPSPTTDNQLSIGNVIYGTNMGNTATGTIGIGVPVPTEKLEVAGKTKTTNLQVTANAGANKILTSDASGNATWQNSNFNTGINVYKNSSQIFANNADTKIDFTAESVDDASAFDLTTDEWTIPSTGFYHLYATARFSSFPANQTVEIVIYVNGLVSKYSRRSISGDVSFDVTADLKLNLNDKIAVFVYQTSGAPATMPAGSATIYFSGYKIY
jgi:trimeric autotransporter adhesin